MFLRCQWLTGSSLASLTSLRLPGHRLILANLSTQNSTNPATIKSSRCARSHVIRRPYPLYTEKGLRNGTKSRPRTPPTLKSQPEARWNKKSSDQWWLYHSWAAGICHLNTSNSGVLVKAGSSEKLQKISRHNPRKKSTSRNDLGAHPGVGDVQCPVSQTKKPRAIDCACVLNASPCIP